ncbi:aminotransferase class V-fold PLP-dependent enzyme [Corynebacterium uterequi]|uniref:Selenocysteine lyase n=1 Tax=Corynebacterium uterequi TaxID=1072256 RepID=A0A0G3H9W0_9CORY|nr:aminotransferase class V-fold PLP-dependent enzyme [Corynebacterium uterequi]AKK10126.1 selenocysteine lyase [Corynebacterium uterequi]
MSRYDVFSVRGLYPSLSDGWTYLNAHSVPQIPERVASGVALAFRRSTTIVEPIGQRPTTKGDGVIRDAKAAVADLVGVDPDCVVLGPSLPVLHLYLAQSMRRMWRHNSSVVLSRIDAPELVTPFASATSDVRWARPDLGTGELPEWQFSDLVDGSTRLVSAGVAHPELGTVVDVANVVERVRERSRAWVLVDASHLAPYYFIDIEKWGADIVGLDLAAMGGPQIAALAFRDSMMFRRLESVTPLDTVTAGTADVLHSTVSAGLAGGVVPLVDHYASFVDTPGTRRERLEVSMGEMSAYLRSLGQYLYTLLETLPTVHVLGMTGEAAAGANRHRLPRLSFAMPRVPAETIQRRLVDNQIITTLTTRSELLIDMGIDEVDGAVTVGLGPFNRATDLEHLVRVVASLA